MIFRWSLLWFRRTAMKSACASISSLLHLKRPEYETLLILCQLSVLCLWSHLYAICISSRLPPDSRVDPWRLRIRISVLWQRELQPAQVHIYTTNVFGRLPRAIFFLSTHVHFSRIQWTTVHPQSRERSRKRSGAQTLQKSSRYDASMRALTRL